MAVTVANAQPDGHTDKVIVGYFIFRIHEPNNIALFLSIKKKYPKKIVIEFLFRAS